MPLLLIIIGLLLALFGGGCTVVFLGFEADSEFFVLWLFLGLVPLVGGIFLIRRGMRLRRERQDKP